MPERSPVTLVGLDIGTSKTAVIIAVAGSISPKLIGAEIGLSVGLRKGVIIDPEACARSIGQVLEKAEKMTGINMTSAYISYNGIGTTVRDCRAVFPVDSHELSCGSIKDGIPADEKVLQLLPGRNMPDYFWHCPESATRAITAPVGDITNIISSARMAGLVVRDVIYGPLAAAQVLLTPAERELGTLLVDIGAEVTSISIFDKSMIKETAVIPVGGGHLVGDLAIGLRTSMARAEKILKEYSFMVENEGMGDFSTTVVCEESENKVPGDLIRSIIVARITEIMELVAVTVKGFNYPGLLPGGAVFYGGVARLRGLALLAEGKLGMPVRIEKKENKEDNVLENAGEPALGPEYTNALGLVKYGFTLSYQSGRDRKKRRKQYANRFLKWFQGRIKDDSRCL